MNCKGPKAVGPELVQHLPSSNGLRKRHHGFIILGVMLHQY